MGESLLPPRQVLRRDDGTYYAGMGVQAVQWTDRLDLAMQMSPEHAESMRALIGHCGFLVKTEPAPAPPATDIGST